MESEVAFIKRRIEQECEALRLAMDGCAVITSHEAITALATTAWLTRRRNRKSWLVLGQRRSNANCTPAPWDGTALSMCLVAGDQGGYMQPQRETLTDSLSNIIQILHLGYRSGTLTVERNAGQTIEEGYIVFVNGKAVDAQANQCSGLAAFNYLKTWGSCRFSFINVSDTNTISPSRSHSSNHVSAPFLSGSLAPTDAYGKAVHFPFPRLSQAGKAAISHLESLPVQRIHRRLLLLIDGQRNLTELARLMARNPDGVQVLLDDLEQAGLIQQ